MSHLTGSERARYVRAMFGRIAHRYDLLNRLMTLGQDGSWRKFAIRQLRLGPKSVVLDVGSGTGDIALAIKRKYPDALVAACDFTPEMLTVGKRRRGSEGIEWVIADAQHLPFASGCADGVISGFLLRNVPDLGRALAEQYRALKAGGRVASLDTTPPRKNPLRPLIEFHLHRVIPLLGRLVAGDAEAYTYLPSSTEQFESAEALAERFEAAGFEEVGFARRMLGTVGIHWGERTEGSL